jgi:(S)-3,5-dihydroxyphenylglycine transaminase
MQPFNTINPLLTQLGEDVMGFLNEIQLNYPQAISLGSGRPDEKYFGVQEFATYFNRYVDALAAASDKDKASVVNSLGQYNRTKGIINQLLCSYLEKDEAIHVHPEDILVTVGTQESMVLSLITLCDREKDVILVEDPAYVGITHLALINGYTVAPVPVQEDGISLPAITAQIEHFAKKGKKVKLVYVTPDFQNPTGSQMPLEKRHALLALARQHDCYLLEDNAYGDFAYDGAKLPPLKALDKEQRVLYMRSFSKTIYPSLRLGALVAGQMVHDGEKPVALSNLLAKTKGYITVNTPAITQAVMGGMLLQQNCSLKKMNAPKVAHMQQKRDMLLSALQTYLNPQVAPWASGIRWNVPAGGFFITIHVPFDVGKDEMIECAENYQVLFTPMRFFYLQDGGHRQIRIAFSYVPDNQITTAIERLAMYFKSKTAQNLKKYTYAFRQ